MTELTDLLLTERERAQELDELSDAERRFFLAALVNSFPKVFDSILVDLKRRPSGLEEVTH